MKKSEIEFMIKDAILNNRVGVLSVVRKSNIIFSHNITNDDLFRLITYNLSIGNGYLAHYLTQFLAKEELNKRRNKKYSNWVTLAVMGATAIYGGVSGYYATKGAKDKAERDRKYIESVADTEVKIAETQKDIILKDLEIKKIEKAAKKIETKNKVMKIVTISSIIGTTIWLGVWLSIKILNKP